MFRVKEADVRRVKTGAYASREGDTFGSFTVDSCIPGRQLAIIASDGSDWEASGLTGVPWEHVSVHSFQGGGGSRRLFTPTWAEMCYVKSLFWEPEDVVIQFHPAESQYVNMHKHVLHLWRPVGVEIPVPPALTVGVQGVTLV